MKLAGIGTVLVYEVIVVVSSSSTVTVVVGGAAVTVSKSNQNIPKE